jgi:Uma2 family endonuclease
VATLVRDPEPIELQQLRERREQLGLDRHDEVWEGVLHITPPPTTEHQYVLQQLSEVLGPLARSAGLVPLVQVFAVGEGRDEYRAPDGGLHRSQPHGVWQSTAALVIEVVSPGDETWDKLPFYAAHNVDELLIVDPQERVVHWFALKHSKYEPVQQSALIDLGPAELTKQLTWP